MRFNTVSARWGETQVDALPSTPDGYFRVEDPYTGAAFPVGSISLLEVKARHAKAVQGGNASVMERYLVTDDKRPGYVSFKGCDAGVPDPLQPVGTRIYVRGAQEVRLDRASTFDDAHRSVGEWWAQRFLNPVVDIDDGEIIHVELPEDTNTVLAEKAGDFALILADISRTRDVALIRVDYEPDTTLRDAADMIFVHPFFSMKSQTYRNELDVVTAREGLHGEVTQIWPPVS